MKSTFRERFHQFDLFSNYNLFTFKNVFNLFKEALIFFFESLTSGESSLESLTLFFDRTLTQAQNVKSSIADLHLSQKKKLNVY